MAVTEDDIIEIKRLQVLNLKVNAFLLKAFSDLEGFKSSRRKVLDLFEEAMEFLKTLDKKRD